LRERVWIKIKRNNNSAFSLIELSIVIIIMGLLVAGVTGGASIIENAKVTSLKREVDGHIRDIFTFYARTGRLPGDLDNSGKIGHTSGRGPYYAGSFPEPYNLINVSMMVGPFIELYLYGISSFKPDPSVNNIQDHPMHVANTTIPFSKIYKGFAFFHRYTNDAGASNSNYFLYQLMYKTTVDILTTKGGTESNAKIMSIVKKIESKFDDGNYNAGNIRGYCVGSDGENYGYINYSNAIICGEITFVFDVK
jgi:prepilin-type N-terminal cleavage/methylation domain-containing protein